MPKECLHLLVAGLILPHLTARCDIPPATNSQLWAYLLGSISPDALFYDFPSFRYAPAAVALHRLEGPAGVEFLHSFATEFGPGLTPETRLWLLGVGSHLLLDGFWHPFIEKVGNLASSLSVHGRHRLSNRQAHHWLESNLEGYWLNRAGPMAGYRQLLKDFAEPGETRDACLHCVQQLLQPLKVNDVPDVKRIGRCFSWQSRLLGQFSRPFWARRRELLLRFRTTRLCGTLIVPLETRPESLAAHLAQAGIHCRDPLEELFSEQLMARSLRFVTTHLFSLAGRL